MGQSQGETVEQLRATDRLYLTVGELHRITGMRACAEQADWLRARGVPFVPGRHGIPLVGRSQLPGLPAAVIRADDSESATGMLEEIARTFAAPLPGVVYVLDEGGDDSAAKVGWSSVEDVRWRMQALQGGNPRRLRLVHVDAGSERLERLVHRMLRPHWLSGEWFTRGAPVVRFLAAARVNGYRAALEALAREP